VQNGKLADGITYLQKAHAAKPGNPEIALHFATALAKSGKTHRRALWRGCRETTLITQRALQELLKTL